MLKLQPVKKLHLSLKSASAGTPLRAARIIGSLPCGDGNPQKIYTPEIISWRQPRQCAFCGKTFTPKQSAQKWQRFCGRGCSASWRMRQPEIRSRLYTVERSIKISERLAKFYRGGSPEAQAQIERIRALNPMLDKTSVQKMIETKTRTGTLRRAPPQGGNGHPLPLPVRHVLRGLSGDWIPEYAVSLGRRKHGFPTCYKLDIANPDTRIGLEIDGGSHSGKRKALDRKKDTALASLGWKVLRFSNKEVLNWINTGMRKDAFIVTTLKQNGIILSL
jgi:hypothetical protein